MKKLAGCLILGLFAATVPLSSAADRRLVRLEGWVVDQRCGVKNANADAAACVKRCHEEGSPLIFVAEDGTTYSLKNQEKALEQVGRKVKIFGSLDGNRNLEVGSYTPVEKEAEDTSAASTTRRVNVPRSHA